MNNTSGLPSAAMTAAMTTVAATATIPAMVASVTSTEPTPMVVAPIVTTAIKWPPITGRTISVMAAGIHYAGA